MSIHDELLRLAKQDPKELYRRIREETREFVFGAIDKREAFGEEWGGEFRVMINHNIVLHIIPNYNGEMRSKSELPQFCIFADDERDGVDEENLFEFEDDEDLGSFLGIIFYVSLEEYRRISGELEAVIGIYKGFTTIPDTYFLETRFVRLVSERVLRHPVIQEERRFDFSKLRF
jgi:hypothetical protein